MSDNGGALVRRYRFTVDGRSFGSPVRSTFELAARDAVAAGYAQWYTSHEVIFKCGGDVETIE